MSGDFVDPDILRIAREIANLADCVAARRRMMAKTALPGVLHRISAESRLIVDERAERDAARPLDVGARPK